MKARSQFSSIPTKHFRRSGTQRNALSWTKTSVLRELERLADRRVRAKMAYFSVNVPKALGISAPLLHALAKRIGRNHRLAQQLWATGVHEARILATLIGQTKKVTAREMERWVRDFDSWDVVDAACCYLYAHAKPAWSKAMAWSRRPEEFVKRASFSLIAYLSYKDKCAAGIEECGGRNAAAAEDGLSPMKPSGNGTKLKIRRAKSADAPQIAVLSGQLGYPATTAEVRKRLAAIRPASQHAVFVADSPENGVIGWTHVSKQPLLEVEIRAEVNGLVVAEGHRSLGAGALLLAAAEEWARK